VSCKCRVHFVLLFRMFIKFDVLIVGKKTWPELVGINGEAAAQIIMSENSLVTARTLPEDSVVTTDFRCDRVRVFVDKQDVVTRVPKIG